MGHARIMDGHILVEADIEPVHVYDKVRGDSSWRIEDDSGL